MNESTEIQVQEKPPTITLSAEIERVLVTGDLSKLTPEQRVTYYGAVCQSAGLNPLTRPFEYIVLNNKLTLYARRDCTDQLRKLHGVSVEIKAREMLEDCYLVTAGGTERGGRHDESIGAVSVKGLSGEARANAMMKAETKAKRRVTLSLCGLGMLDEMEVESIPGAVVKDEIALESVAAPQKDEQTGFLFIVSKVREVTTFTGTSQKTGKPFTKFTLHMESGQDVTTFSESLVDIAQDAIKHGDTVKVSFEESRWGLDLRDIQLPDKQVEIIVKKAATYEMVKELAEEKEIDHQFERALANDDRGPFALAPGVPVQALSPDLSPGKMEGAGPPSPPTPVPDSLPSKDTYEELLAVCQSEWAAKDGLSVVRKGLGMCLALPDDVRKRLGIKDEFLKPGNIRSQTQADAVLSYLLDRKAVVRNQV
jgi:hypothetical protein